MTTTDERLITDHFWTTEGGQRLHVAACWHLKGKDDVRRATPEEVAARTLCDTCERQISGAGRTYVGSVDEVIRAFKLPPEGQSMVRAAAARTAHDEIWIVHGRSYFALGLVGRRVLMVYRSHLEDVHGVRAYFPGYSAGGGRRSAAAVAPQPTTKHEACGYLLLATGDCGYCD